MERNIKIAVIGLGYVDCHLLACFLQNMKQ